MRCTNTHNHVSQPIGGKTAGFVHSLAGMNGSGRSLGVLYHMQSGSEMHNALSPVAIFPLALVLFYFIFFIFLGFHSVYLLKAKVICAAICTYSVGRMGATRSSSNPVCRGSNRDARWDLRPVLLRTVRSRGNHVAGSRPTCRMLGG